MEDRDSLDGDDRRTSVEPEGRAEDTCPVETSSGRKEKHSGKQLSILIFNDNCLAKPGRQPVGTDDALVNGDA